MPLVLAIKNSKAVVVASDAETTAQPGEFGQMMPLRNRCVLLMAGNLEPVRQSVVETVLPKVRPDMGAAELAQLLNAAMVMEVVPHLPDLKGRIELIVAGIDPVRHVEELSLYYMDSARDFHLEIVSGYAVAAGATAAITSLLAGHDFSEASTDQLKVLAKECLSSTKMRWPAALGNHVTLGVVTPQATQIQVI